jgi:amino acid transporter
MIMMLVIMVFRIGVMMFIAMGVNMTFFALLVSLMGLWRLRRIDACALQDLALDAVAMAATSGVAVAGAAAMAGAVFALFFGLAMGAFIRLDQRLTVGDRDLIIVGMDFAEGEEAVAVAAILDERRLQRRFYPRDFGEIDIAAQLFALGGLEIKLFDAIAADHNDPGLFRVGSIDQHFVGHFGTLDGGGRVWRCAHLARPGDATVHLIRG